MSNYVAQKLECQLFVRAPEKPVSPRNMSVRSARSAIPSRLPLWLARSDPTPSAVCSSKLEESVTWLAARLFYIIYPPTYSRTNLFPLYLLIQYVAGGMWILCVFVCVWMCSSVLDMCSYPDSCSTSLVLEQQFEFLLLQTYVVDKYAVYRTNLVCDSFNPFTFLIEFSTECPFLC